MSAETIVKKRGRPKKIVSEPIEVELTAPEVKKAPSRAKSKTATPKTTKKATATTKVPVVKKSTPKSAVVPKSLSQSIEASAPLPKAAPNSVKVAPQTAPPENTVTAESSKILQQVRELPAKAATPVPTISKISATDPSKRTQASQAAQINHIPAQSSKTIRTTDTAKPSIPQQPEAAPAPTSSKSPPPPPVSKPVSPPSSNTMPKATPKIPLAAFNSAVVSNISERAGARPNTARSKALPQSYNTVARKVTFAIVAMPIAIVTSYVLYQRLVLGDDRKLLVPAKDDSAPPPDSTKSSSSET